jgi:predicted transcriptional regulator YdeE
MAIERHEYRMEQFDTFTVAGVAERGTDIDPDALWAALGDFSDALHDVAVSSERYGVFFEFDQGGEEMTYLVGHEVDSTGDLPPQLTAVEIPEGRYAVFSQDAVDFNQIRTTVNDELLFDADHEMRDALVFHRYRAADQQFDAATPTEWFVPVEDE